MVASRHPAEDRIEGTLFRAFLWGRVRIIVEVVGDDQVTLGRDAAVELDRRARALDAPAGQVK